MPSTSLRHPLFSAFAWLLVALLSGSVLADSATRTSAFAYDATTGLLTKEIIEPDNPDLCLVTTYSYDGYGNKTGSTTRNCNGSVGEAAAPTGESVFASRSSGTGYDSKGQFPTSSSNALSQSETRVYDAKFGGATSLTGPNGLTTTWTYDGFGRKTLETRADTTTTSITYTACTSSCPAHGAYYVTTTTSGAPQTIVYYDMLQREVRNAVKGFDLRWVYQDTEYDDQGRAYRVSQPYYEGGAVYWATRYYDELGRVTKVTELDDNGATISTLTDYAGLTTTVTDAKGHATTTVKNSQGQVLSVIDAQDHVTTYHYDPYGNLLSTEDSNGNAIVNTYDARGRKLTMDDPDMGHWTYAYNALGEMVRQVDSNDHTVTLAYDLLGRMIQRNEADLISNWYFDSYQDGSACTKGKGKLCEVTADNGTRRKYAFDSYGRVSSVTAHVDADYVVSQTYDSYSRPLVVTYPGGFALKNVYANGYLSKLQNNDASGLVYWQALLRDAEGRVTSEILANGLTTTRVFSPQQGRLTSILANGPNGTVQNRSFGYDALGNLNSRGDAVRNTSDTYTYDSLNRLATATGTNLNLTMAYDALGNITYKSDAGTYTYAGPRPHAVTQISGTVNSDFAYDAKGNLLSGNGRTLVWASYGKPVSLEQGGQSTLFLYDFDHARAQQTAPDGTVTRYVEALGIHYEKEIKNGLTEYKHSLLAGGRLIGEYVSRSDGSSSIRYFHADHLGSVEVVTSETGAVLARYSYDPWGKRSTVEGDGSIADQGYTGHEMLDNGLIHMGGRVYDPVLGRFMSADPIIQAPYLSQNLNRYSYVLNNPLSLTDPDGYCFLGCFWKSKVFRMVASIAVAVFAPEFLTTNFGFSAAGANLTAGFASGVISTGNMQGGVMGAFSAGMFMGIHSAFPAPGFDKVLAHAVAGGVMSELQGGDFGSGALSGGFTQAVSWSGVFDGVGDPTTWEGRSANALAAAVVGGTASVIGGGKFGNGALTGAFSRLFNDLKENQLRGLAGEAARSADLPGALRGVRIGVTVDGKIVEAVADFVYRNGGLVIDEVKVGSESKFSVNQKVVYQAALQGNIQILDSSAAKKLGVDLGTTLARQGVPVTVNLVSFGAARAQRQAVRMGLTTIIKYGAPLLLLGPVVGGAIDFGLMVSESNDAH